LSVTPAVLVKAPVARIQVYPPGVDQRDLLDLAAAGHPPRVDLLITRDPAVISYAGGKAGFSVLPLVWDRTYVAVSSSAPADPARRAGDFQAALAREVVRADARGARGPFWWETEPCGGTRPRLPMGRLPQVVYLEGDVTGRALAERMVALERPALRAAGLDAERFAASLAGGEAAMYVLALSRSAPGNCAGAPSWPSAATVLPLVDTRPHAVVRTGVPPITIEYDGTVRFDQPLPLIPDAGPGR
jgi:hypothetical protein